MESFCSVVILLCLVSFVACDGDARTFGSSGSYTDTLLNGFRRMENQARRKAAVVRPALTNAVVDECYPICPIGTVCAIEFGVRRCVAAPIITSAAVDTGYNNPLIASATVSAGYNNPLIASATVGADYNDQLIASGPVGDGYNDQLIASAGVGAGYNDPLVASASAYDEPAIASGVVRSAYTDRAVGFGAGYNEPVLISDYNHNSGVVISGAANLGVVGIAAGPGIGYSDNVVRVAGCGVVPSECRANQVNPGFLSGAYKYTFDYSLNRCVQVSVCSTCASISGPRHNLFNNLFSCNGSC